MLFISKPETTIDLGNIDIIEGVNADMQWMSTWLNVYHKGIQKYPLPLI